MPYTNPYFSNTTGVVGEVNLLDDLVREQIKMFGVDLIYMPRKMLNLDHLLHESSKNAFEIGMPVPAYIKTFDGYDNGVEMLSKFGVRSSDELTIQISRSEFTTYYAPFLKSYYNANAGRPGDALLDRFSGETAHRPKEGDLIYFPFDDGIFEIKYVMFDQPFFQLGRGYVFELQCEKFEYSGATFDTGYEQVDDVTIQPDFYRLEFNLEIDGTGTFQTREDVIIYSLADYDINDPYEGFRLYKDPGFSQEVEKVKGTVQYWHLPNRKLTLSDLSDLDPEQTDLYRDLTVNEFDKVMIVGQTSGAVWFSTKAFTQEKAFDDGDLIQSEFDQIKIIDEPGDVNPFGFV